MALSMVWKQFPSSVLSVLSIALAEKKRNDQVSNIRVATPCAGSAQARYYILYTNYMLYTNIYILYTKLRALLSALSGLVFSFCNFDTASEVPKRQ